MRQLLVAAMLGVATLACTIDRQGPAQPSIAWDDLALQPILRPKEFNAPLRRWTRPRYAAAYQGQSRRARLAWLLADRSVVGARAYENGVVGQVGSALIYLTTSQSIRTYQRLYWVMVKILSEKYGCFMKARYQRNDVTIIKCRDSRQIALWHSKGPGWMQFYARQFDRQGYEINVVQRRMVRISRRRLLTQAF